MKYTIEQNIERIADALSSIAAAINQKPTVAEQLAEAHAAASEPEKPKKTKAEKVYTAEEKAAEKVEKVYTAEQKAAAEEAQHRRETAQIPKAEEPKAEEPVTREKLREVGTRLVAAGKGAKMKAILASFQAEKISAVPETSLAEAYKLFCNAEKE